MKRLNKRTIRFILFFVTLTLQQNSLICSNILSDSTSYVYKAILDQPYKPHSKFYNWVWGTHYQNLYTEPIETKAIYLDSFRGGLSFIERVPTLDGFLYKLGQQRYYLVKNLKAGDSFLKSKFFKQVYDRQAFKNTYLGNFIDEAYTIKNPFAFLVSGNMAQAANLDAGNTSFYYIKHDTSDSLDSDSLDNNLASFNAFPNLSVRDVLVNTEDLLAKRHDGVVQIDQFKYIRLRLFDMLVGDWNQIPENRMWVSFDDNDSIIYEPFVLDRSHTFTKVDGAFFQQLLDMLGLSFITDYGYKLKNVRKFNALGYPADMALTAASGEKDWVEQAKYLQTTLTDSLIDVSFARFPKTMSTEEIDILKQKFKERKTSLDKTARKYFAYLQKVPVITGSDCDEEYTIKNDSLGRLNVQIFNKQTGQMAFDKTYNSRQTKEIWLYLLDGKNTVNVNKENHKIALSIIGGKGDDAYKTNETKGVKLYTTQTNKEHLDSLKLGMKVISPSDKSALIYDYEKTKYAKLGLTPIGVYDSDLGLNIGTSLTYTIYGFKRSPYSQQHQLSYNYSSGFVYQGIFPDYNAKKSFHLSAFIGSLAYFSNFFGFGNETLEPEGENKDYNRVHIKKATITPAFYYTFNKDQEFNVYSSFQMFKVVNPKNRDRYVNQVYLDDSDIFKREFFVELGTTYTFDKKMDSFLSSVKFVVNPGWTINMADPKLNFPFIDVDLGFNLKLTDRLTLATIVNGKAILSNKYEFYQAASAQLRGFRNNRFIGRQSLYEYTDLRFDMGRLNNPLTPLEYGLFVGVDHGRVWYPGEYSTKWYTSYGGGLWLTLFKQFTGKFSYFTSKDGNRFTFGLGFSF